jgi:hypothetical protein
MLPYSLARDSSAVADKRGIVTLAADMMGQVR